MITFILTTFLLFQLEQPPLIEAPTAPTISGQTTATAGDDTLIRLTATVPDGHNVTWLPLAPRHGLDSAYSFLESDGLTWGCATPTNPTTIRVQLIDWSAQSWAFHEIAVTSSGDDPPPPPADKLTIFIIEETQDRGPHMGDIYSRLQRDPDLAPHSLAIIDDDQTGVLAQYAALTPSRPAIIIDTDWNPSEVRYAGPCPDSVESIRSLLSQYTTLTPHPAPGSMAPSPSAQDVAPIPQLSPPQETRRVSASEASPSTPTIAPVPFQRRARYVWRTEPDGTRWGVDTETGNMYPVNEKTRTFCLGDGRCFRVPAK